MTKEEAIRLLPSLGPIINALDRQKGEWVLGDGYHCSSCGYKLQTTAIPRSCPNCGADMRGDTE